MQKVIVRSVMVKVVLICLDPFSDSCAMGIARPKKIVLVSTTNDGSFECLRTSNANGPCFIHI